MALLISEFSEGMQGVPWMTPKEYIIIKYISILLYSSQWLTKFDATNHKTI